MINVFKQRRAEQVEDIKDFWEQKGLKVTRRRVDEAEAKSLRKRAKRAEDKVDLITSRNRHNAHARS